ncbi:MAG: ABC transporter permease [Desulfobacteraceae bacterium]|nr:ABC transporter permease [Desulfobacteraceae bacterium]
MGQITRILKTRFFRGIVHCLIVGLVVASLSFVVANLTSGDTALEIAIARYGIDMTDESLVEQIRIEEKLDQPLCIQYCQWIFNAFTLDLGRSLVSKEKVVDLLIYHFRHTIMLGVVAMVISIVIALPLGIVCGIYPEGSFDNFAALLSSALVAIPHFVTGIILILFFAIKFQWLPVAGFFSSYHLILPALTLGIGLAAFSSRVIATATVNVREAVFYRFSQMKGLPESRVLLVHGVRNASIPVITFFGLQMAHLLDGVVVVETLFAWPGIGQLILDSVLARDIPVVQGVGLLMGIMYVGVNLTVDFICTLLDPIQRYAEAVH